jgi:YidC/Oxa1 family membrane protein insertase
VPTDGVATGFGGARLFGELPISATFLSPSGMTGVRVPARGPSVAMTATTLLTQRQLMSKNMPADALSGPCAQQRMLLYVLPVVFAVVGIACPIGVLF